MLLCHAHRILSNMSEAADDSAHLSPAEVLLTCQVDISAFHLGTHEDSPEVVQIHTDEIRKFSNPQKGRKVTSTRYIGEIRENLTVHHLSIFLGLAIICFSSSVPCPMAGNIWKLVCEAWLFQVLSERMRRI